MPIQITLPDELAAQIDSVASDRAAFVEGAVRRSLRDGSAKSPTEEVAQINAVADELNKEAADVLEFQLIP